MSEEERQEELIAVVMEQANKELLQIHVEEGRIAKSSLGYMAPEQYPAIQSTQVKAAIRALIKVFNLRPKAI
jgi:hypothetical protein